MMRGKNRVEMFPELASASDYARACRTIEQAQLLCERRIDEPGQFSEPNQIAVARKHLNRSVRPLVERVHQIQSRMSPAPVKWVARSFRPRHCLRSVRNL